MDRLNTSFRLLLLSPLLRPSLSTASCFGRGILNPCSSGGSSGSKGVEDPDSVSFFPLSPLCSLVLGAGSPLRKCSSSASVPLSLAGVESLVKTAGGTGSWMVGPNLAEAWRSSRFCRWYGWGDRESSLKFSPWSGARPSAGEAGGLVWPGISIGATWKGLLRRVRRGACWFVGSLLNSVLPLTPVYSDHRCRHAMTAADREGFAGLTRKRAGEVESSFVIT